MKLAVSISLSLALVGGVYLLRMSGKASSDRPFGSSTDEFVEWLANEAVKDAWEQNQIKLDYRVESIKNVDQILGKLHEQYARDRSTISVQGLGSAYGAYIGEVIRRSEPGSRWQRDDAIGEKSYPLIWGAGHSYPMAWCSRRILNGDEDNVWLKYRALKEGLGRSGTSTANH